MQQVKCLFIAHQVKVAHDSRSTAWVGFDGRNRQEIKHGERYVPFPYISCHVVLVLYGDSLLSSIVSWLQPALGPYPPSTTQAMLQTGLIALQSVSIGMPGNSRNQNRFITVMCVCVCVCVCVCGIIMFVQLFSGINTHYYFVKTANVCIDLYLPTVN